MAEAVTTEVSPALAGVNVLLRKRLEQYTVKEASCWRWAGSLSPKGYGKIQLGKKHLRAHRVAYEVYIGEILSTDLQVLHTCDNPSCVNPLHLVAGTNADNMQQKKERGRSASGERHGMSKLSDFEAREILKACKEGTLSMRGIARAFGVSLGCVGNIKYRSLK